MDSLLYGCLLALMVWTGRAETLFPDAARYRWAWLAGAGLLLLVSLAIRDESFRTTLRYRVQGLALMPIFHYAVSRPTDILFRWLNAAPIRRIGQWSYAIYLGHFVIIGASVRSGIGELGSPIMVALAAVLSVA